MKTRHLVAGLLPILRPVAGAAEDNGLEVVGNEEYDTAALDMTPQLQVLQAQEPDVLIMDA